MSRDGQGTKCHKYCSKFQAPGQGARALQTTNRQTTDGRTGDGIVHVRYKTTVFGRPFVNGSPYAIGPLSCSVSSVCDVGVIVFVAKRWNYSSRHLPKKWRSPQFSAYVYCGQTAAWIKVLFGTEVGLGLRHIALDENLLPLP